MVSIVPIKDANYNLIGHTGCYDCMITHTCTNYNKISCLISCVRSTKKVWKPKLILIKYKQTLRQNKTEVLVVSCVRPIPYGSDKRD